MISIPEQPDFSVGENNVLALDCGQLQSQVSHLRLHLPLLLPGLHLLTLDIQQHLLLAQLLEQVAELWLDATEMQNNFNKWTDLNYCKKYLKMKSHFSEWKEMQTMIHKILSELILLNPKL